MLLKDSGSCARLRRGGSQYLFRGPSVGVLACEAIVRAMRPLMNLGRESALDKHILRRLARLRKYEVDRLCSGHSVADSIRFDFDCRPFLSHAEAFDRRRGPDLEWDRAYRAKAFAASACGPPDPVNEIPASSTSYAFC